MNLPNRRRVGLYALLTSSAFFLLCHSLRPRAASMTVVDEAGSRITGLFAEEPAPADVLLTVGNGDSLARPQPCGSQSSAKGGWSLLGVRSIAAQSCSGGCTRHWIDFYFYDCSCGGNWRQPYTDPDMRDYSAGWRYTGDSACPACSSICQIASCANNN